MAGPTSKSGTIAADEVWLKKDAPFNVVGDVVINDGITVQVEAGVEVVFTGRFVIRDAGLATSTGRLMILGTRQDPVVVHGYGTGLIAGVGFKVVGGGGGTLPTKTPTQIVPGWTIQSCRIRDMEVAIAAGDSSVSVSKGGTLYLEDVLISNCRVGLRLSIAPDNTDNPGTQYGPFLALKDVVIERCTSGIEAWPAALAGSCRNRIFLFGGALTLRRNGVGIRLVSASSKSNVSILGASELALRAGQCRIHDNDIGLLFDRDADATLVSDLRNVWWGSDDGPDDSSETVVGWTNLNGSGDRIDFVGTGPALPLISPVAALGRYVPKLDAYRDFIGQLVKQQGVMETLIDAIPADELERHLVRAEQIVDGWFDDRAPIENRRLFAYGTETNEAHNWNQTGKFRLRYWPVRSVSAAQQRTGDTSWSSVQQNSEWGGWYAGSDDMRKGVVRVHYIFPAFRADAFRFTYVHGYPKIPDWLERITMRVAAKETLMSLLSPAIGGALSDRQTLLDAEIEAFAAAARRKRRNYVLVSH